MENILTKTTALAMYITAGYIDEGDLALDATCGNGRDTLSLALAAGAEGHVLAIDLQPAAVEMTKKLLEIHQINNVTVCQENFVHLRELANALFPGKKPAAVIFNLGYLPGGNKSFTTKKEDTLQAVDAALDLIKVGGVVTVVLYSGHEEGAREKAALLQMAEKLPASQYHVAYTSLLNQKTAPPEVLFITKKK
ncbi:class I SAM-dependent methyltransferase [Ihubacter sp. mB4P-1]|uniref:tRNA (mnm(5)s(2)U34)-methyltransferase n=1 Tax=Ihubacter sp. mB4P-1 TaxID=3242370 RepID=UPI001379C31A